MTQQEINDWDELYQYVRHDILAYGNKALNKRLVLRLKGLTEGKFMANKKIKPRASYTYKQILTTFKLSKAKLDSYMIGTQFTNEQHKINGIMLIIENEINDVVDMLERKEKMVQVTESIDTTHFENEGAQYTRKSKGVSNRLKDLI